MNTTCSECENLVIQPAHGRTLVCSDECRKAKRSRLRSPNKQLRSCSECGGSLPATKLAKGRSYLICNDIECKRSRRNRLRLSAPSRLTICLDCQETFEASAVGILPKRCEGCNYWHRRKQNSKNAKLYLETHPEKKGEWAERAKVKPRPNRNIKRLYSAYGLTESDYLLMFERQNGLCGICSLSPEGRGKNGVLVVDHDHLTGKIRSLLCGNCNTALGLLDESFERLKKVEAYLLLWR